MGRISRHFDNLVIRQWTLNFAIIWIACFSFTCSVGIFQIIKYAKTDDSGGLILGICSVTIGAFCIWTGSQILHSVVRRLVAEARQKP